MGSRHSISMKKVHTLCVILCVGLLVLLVWQIGLSDLLSEFRTLGWGLVPLVLIEGVADIFHTLGWRHCLSEPHRSLPFFRIFRIRMAGAAINHVTPAALGGEVAKGVLLSSDHKSAEAITGVMVGKLAYVLAQLLLVSLGSVFTLWGVELPAGVWPALLAGSSILALGVLGFLLVQKYGKLGVLIRWIVARRIGGKLLQTAERHITDVDNALEQFYREHPRDLGYAILWHIVGLSFGTVQTWLFLLLLSDHPSILLAAGIWFLGTWFDLLTFAIPMGIGIQEATRVIAFNAVGYGSVMGLAFGIALRLELIFWAGFGLLCYASLLYEERRAKAVAAGSPQTASFSFPNPRGRE